LECDIDIFYDHKGNVDGTTVMHFML